MDKRAVATNLIICCLVGGAAAYFTEVKWLTAALLVFAALHLNGSFAYYEDGRPGGFDNPDGNSTPEYAKGVGAIRFWAVSLLVVFAAVAVGLYAQFHF